MLGVLIGFSGTFFIPVSKGSFRAPAVIYVHGAFAFAWIILFVTQTFLIRFDNYKTHIFLGFAGIGIALGAVLTIIPAGMFATSKDLINGAGGISYSQTTGSCTSALLFLTLVTLGISRRTTPAVHKRIMLLATIFVLWPAWFRFRHFFPSVPRPDIWFGLILSDSLIILSWFLDKKLNGRIHPILLYGGIGLIIENVIEIILFDSELWQVFGKAVYSTFNEA